MPLTEQKYMTNMDVQLVLQSRLRGYTVQYQTDDFLYLSKGARLYYYTIKSQKIVTIGTVPTKHKGKSISFTNLLARALRYKAYNIVPLNHSDFFVSFGREIFILRGNEWSRLTDKVGEFRILRGGVALSSSGDLYFGEYIKNSSRLKEVRIFKLPSNSTSLEMVHIFPPGQIRHIHGIHIDPFDESIWVCAGDIGNECLVARSRDYFKTLEVIGRGDESWRTISPVFTEQYIYYATDAEYMQNAVFRIDRETGNRIQICDINGPSYYSGRSGSSVYIGTTAELCPAQTTPECHLISIYEDNAVIKKKYKKNLFGIRFFVKYFQPGIIEFSYNSRAPPASR